MEKKQGRTRGSHSKCERRIWLQTSGASHAYTLVHATANIGVLQLCFSPGLRPLLRCFTSSVQLSGGRFCLRHQTGRITRVPVFVSTLPYSFELCRHKPLRLPKSARQGKVELLLCTYTDLDSRQGKVLGISSWSGVPSAPAERLSSLLCSLRILLAWQWNRPSTPVVLDPPNLGYWTDSSNWDLVGRPGKAETTFA